MAWNGIKFIFRHGWVTPPRPPLSWANSTKSDHTQTPQQGNSSYNRCILGDCRDEEPFIITAAVWKRKICTLSHLRADLVWRKGTWVHLAQAGKQPLLWNPKIQQPAHPRSPIPTWQITFFQNTPKRTESTTSDDESSLSPEDCLSVPGMSGSKPRCTAALHGSLLSRTSYLNGRRL